MKSKKICVGLKAVLAAGALFGLLVCFWVLPGIGQGTAECYPEYAWCYWPWLLFLWASAAPCFAVIVLAWQIAGSIGADTPFTMANAKRMKWIQRLAIADVVFFGVGNFVFALLDASNPPVLFGSLFIDFLGIAIALAAGALSYLVGKAAELQEQSDLTI